MDDAPKSAVELAMARFKKQDADEGVTDRVLTDDQKNEIAEVRKTYGAKLAQEEILFKSARRRRSIPNRAARSKTTTGAMSSESTTSATGRLRRFANGRDDGGDGAHAEGHAGAEQVHREAAGISHAARGQRP